MSPDTNGGLLTASGTFFSGYQPVIGAESTSPDATAVDYTKGFFDCTTSQIGGDDVVMNNFELTISNPATRVGYETVNSINGEPCAYMRGGQISVTGTVSVKLDDNTAQVITEDFLVGTSAKSYYVKTLFLDAAAAGAAAGAALLLFLLLPLMLLPRKQ